MLYISYGRKNKSFFTIRPFLVIKKIYTTKIIIIYFPVLGWSEWGQCSDACMGTSTRTRSRTGLREESDEEFCDNQDCG